MTILRSLGIFLLLSSSLSYSQLKIEPVKTIDGLNSIKSISVDVYNNIYVLDSENSMIYKYSSSGNPEAQIGGFGWENNSFDKPQDIAVSFSMNVYICDYGNNRIQRFDKNLNYVSTFQNRESDFREGNFGYPNSITISGKGDFYILDAENIRIIKFNSFFEFDKNFRSIDAKSNILKEPVKIRISNSGLYVYDKDKFLHFDEFGNLKKDFYISDSENLLSYFVDDENVYLLRKNQIQILDSDFGYKNSIDLEYYVSTKEEVKDIFVKDKTVFIALKNKILIFLIKSL